MSSRGISGGPCRRGDLPRHRRRILFYGVSSAARNEFRFFSRFVVAEFVRIWAVARNSFRFLSYSAEREHTPNERNEFRSTFPSFSIFHFSFCIFNFAFCILTFPVRHP